MGQASHWQVKTKVEVYTEEMYFLVRFLTFLLKRFKVQRYLVISTSQLQWAGQISLDLSR